VKEITRNMKEDYNKNT